MSKHPHPDMFQDVIDFHEKFGINYTGAPRMIPEPDNEFRIKRMHEEQKEYDEAKTLEEKLDALCDKIYIDLGAAHLHGFDRFYTAWNRVHKKNMQKELSHEGNLGKYGVLGDKRDIVKPPGWTPPNHSDLVKPYGVVEPVKPK